MSDADKPDASRRRALRGRRALGRLVVSSLVADRLERQAAARGLTVPDLCEEWISQRSLAEPDPDP